MAFVSSQKPKSLSPSLSLSSGSAAVNERRMRRKMERLVLLPFSVGCISESSVAVGIQHSGRSKPVDSNSSPRSRDEKDHQVGEEDEAAETLMEESMKNSQRFSALAKPNIAVGFHRIYKGFKNISQLFVYKEEMEEMEIGSPTDVKHVTHIGCDASSRSSDANPLIANWETLLSSTNSWRKFDEVLSNPQNFPKIVHHSI